MLQRQLLYEAFHRTQLHGLWIRDSYIEAGDLIYIFVRPFKQN